MPTELSDILKNSVNFSVNANKKTFDLTILPHGEDKPISFHVNYQLEETEESTNVIITKAASDRIWIDELLKMKLEQSHFHYAVPKNIAGIVKMFLK